MWSRIGVACLVLLALTSAAIAQQRKQPPEKFSPRPVQPDQQADVLDPALVYSPWVKYCGRDKSDPQAKDTCLTVKEARLATGQFIAGAALIEPPGEEKKLLRATLPLGMRVMRGVQLSIDDDALGSADFETCLPNGCMADFEVTPVLVARLKSGAQLRLEGIKVPNNLVRYLFSLADFAAANEGPPTDPARFEQDRRQRNAPPSQPSPSQPPPSQSPPSQPK